jgi:ABC-type transport system involved in cytochrome c biogenesis permease component
MILLPVIERELRVAARTRQTYRNRFIAALGIIGVVLWATYDFRGQPQAALGNEIFDYITFVALVVALLAGFFHTADCISEERREGTLGLLYLTGLRGIDVVFGKLVANSIPAFFALATIVPVLGIPFLLGGITLGELQRAALILLNAFWLSVASGLLASALVKDDRAALLLTLALICVPNVIAPMVHHAELSAFWAMRAGRDMSFLGRSWEFWMAMAEQFALPFIYLLLASLRARAIWTEKPPTAAGQRRRAKWRVWASGTAEQRKEWRTGMLEQNPALWLACRRRERTALLWVVLGLGAVWLTWMWFAEHRIESLLGLMTSIVFHWVLKITFAFAACRALSEESRNGAFELLFTTDLSPQRLMKGHLGGLAQSFGPPVAVVVTFDVLWILFGRSDGFFSDLHSFLWGRTFVLLLDLVTIAVYGLWLGFKLQRSGKATVRALLMVVVIPNLAWIFLLAGRASYAPVFFTWIIMDAGLLALAWHNLRALRERAAERFVARPAQA